MCFHLCSTAASTRLSNDSPEDGHSARPSSGGTYLTPSGVYSWARRELPGLTEPTVYRTLDFLVENGLVHSSHAGSGHLTYEIAGRDHHHLICRVCGSEMEVEHSLLASLYRKLEKASGFRKINSHVTFFGLCPACAAA